MGCSSVESISAEQHGPLVKRLRHRPFTAVSWVRFPYGSPSPPLPRRAFSRRCAGRHSGNIGNGQYAGIAQLVERLICNQRVGGSSPSAGSSFPEWEARHIFLFFTFLISIHHSFCGCFQTAVAPQTPWFLAPGVDALTKRVTEAARDLNTERCLSGL